MKYERGRLATLEQQQICKRRRNTLQILICSESPFSLPPSLLRSHAARPGSRSRSSKQIPTPPATQLLLAIKPPPAPPSLASPTLCPILFEATRRVEQHPNENSANYDRQITTGLRVFVCRGCANDLFCDRDKDQKSSPHPRVPLPFKINKSGPRNYW